MTTTENNDPAPQWAAFAGELNCPLCQYNLRGLEQPRCPECGFAFSWSEILRGQREKHPYLFEHQNRRNIWSFWKTYWTDCRPRKFWSELSPAQPVNLRRLLIYWFIASMTMLFSPVMQFGFDVQDAFQTLTARRAFFNQIYTGAKTVGPTGIPFGMRAVAPAPTIKECLEFAWDNYGDDIRESPLITWSLTVLLWPWVTFLALLLFAQSMRRAKILKRHVLRVVIYGTDFGIVMLIINCLTREIDHGRSVPVFVVLACAAITLYRVYLGYARYLRFHMPLATVLTSQIMVFLVFMIVYLQTFQRF